MFLGKNLTWNFIGVYIIIVVTNKDSHHNYHLLLYSFHTEVAAITDLSFCPYCLLALKNIHKVKEKKLLLDVRIVIYMYIIKNMQKIADS